MNHKDHDDLLGLDWFSLIGASLCPAERMLRFSGQKITNYGKGHFGNNFYEENTSDCKIPCEILQILFSEKQRNLEYLTWMIFGFLLVLFYNVL